MRLSDLRGKSVAVWGTGREGRAAVFAVSAQKPSRLLAVDDSANFRSIPWEGELAALAPLAGGDHAFPALVTADVVVRSPGVPQTHPWVIELRKRGVPITGGSALWMADHASRTVGVTGSKGKSTTSALISHLLTAVDRPNVFGGNIGVPLLDLPDAELYVLELSSYQCSDLTDSPRVAVVTSLFPEHLDAHGGEREYYRDKLNLLAHGPELIVVNGTDQRLAAELGDVRSASGGRPVAAGAPGSRFLVRDDAVYADGIALFPRSALRLPGRHNASNLCVALSVLDGMGVEVVGRAGEIEAAVRAFRGLPHRLAEIEDPSGLTFVDDTLSTTPHSAIHAIDAYAGRPLTVLVGGTDRGLDYTPLRDFLAGRFGPGRPAGDRTARDLSAEGRAARDLSAEGRAARDLSAEGRAARDVSVKGRAARNPSAEGRAAGDPSGPDRDLIVIGLPDSGPRILAALAGLPGVRTENAEDLPSAVRLARKLTPVGGVVLLSPAAPSYGRFRDFEHRSEVFVQAIRESA